ncbi:hypothetical protein G5V59_04765 [Nocardioides sp. W3-2-3]|nr:hypothetical protein [Nocardioides convexus]
MSRRLRLPPDHQPGRSRGLHRRRPGPAPAPCRRRCPDRHVGHARPHLRPRPRHARAARARDVRPGRHPGPPGRRPAARRARDRAGAQPRARRRAPPAG